MQCGASRGPLEKGHRRRKPNAKTDGDEDDYHQSFEGDSAYLEMKREVYIASSGRVKGDGGERDVSRFAVWKGSDKSNSSHGFQESMSYTVSTNRILPPVLYQILPRHHWYR
jgi:hypothetical protein